MLLSSPASTARPCVLQRWRSCRARACVAPRASVQPEDAYFHELVGACGAGVAPGSLLLGHGPYGRGLFLPLGASCAQVLLSVPLPHALVVRGDLDSADSALIERSAVHAHHVAWESVNGVELPEALRMVLDSAFPAEQRLAFFLLFAVRASPLWTQLGTLLPGPDVCPAPLLWTDAELSELQDVSLAMQCSAARQTAARGFLGFLDGWPLGRELHALLGEPTAEQFVWALSMVQSRGMADALPGPDGTPERVALLVPFADMANHYAHDPGFSGSVNAEGSCFELTCCRADGVAGGGELTVSYRDSASNLELFRKYGFVTSKNASDWFLLSRLSPPELRALSLDQARLEPLARAALVKCQADQARLAAVLGSLPLQASDDGPASDVAEQAERAARLHAVLRAELESFPTSLAQDEETLMDASQLGVRLEAAVRYRAERKRLLHAAADAVGLYAGACSRVAAKKPASNNA